MLEVARSCFDGEIMARTSVRRKDGNGLVSRSFRKVIPVYHAMSEYDMKFLACQRTTKSRSEADQLMTDH